MTARGPWTASASMLLALTASVMSLGCSRSVGEPDDDLPPSVLVAAQLAMFPEEGEVTRPGHKGRVASAFWSPDGSRLVTSDPGIDLFVWNVEGGPPIAQWVSAALMEKEVAFRKDGARVAIAAGSQDWGTFRMGDFTGDLVVMIGPPTHRIEFSDDGRLLVAHRADKRWMGEKGAVVAIRGHELVGLGMNPAPVVWEQEAFGFRPFAVAPEGGRVAIATARDRVTMHDVETGDRLEAFWPVRLDDAVVHGFTPDGNIVWLSAHGGEVYNFQASSGFYLGTLAKDVKLISVQGTSTHGERVIGEAGVGWAVVETRTGKVLWRGGERTMPLFQKAAISPDGTRVAVPDFGGTRIIDVATGQTVLALGHIQE